MLSVGATRGIAARGFGVGFSTTSFDFGSDAEGEFGSAASASLSRSLLAGAGEAADFAPELAASGEGVASVVTGAAFAGVFPAAEFVAGLLEAGLGAFAAESGAGCAATGAGAGAAGALVTFGGGALAVLDVGGGVVLVSPPSGFCTAAGGLLATE